MGLNEKIGSFQEMGASPQIILFRMSEEYRKGLAALRRRKEKAGETVKKVPDLPFALLEAASKCGVDENRLASQLGVEITTIRGACKRVGLELTGIAPNSFFSPDTKEIQEEQQPDAKEISRILAAEPVSRPIPAMVSGAPRKRVRRSSEEVRGIINNGIREYIMTFGEEPTTVEILPYVDVCRHVVYSNWPSKEFVDSCVDEFLNLPNASEIIERRKNTPPVVALRNTNTAKASETKADKGKLITLAGIVNHCRETDLDPFDPQFQMPSLYELSNATGLTRTTVRKYMPTIEELREGMDTNFTRIPKLRNSIAAERRRSQVFASAVQWYVDHGQRLNKRLMRPNLKEIGKTAKMAYETLVKYYPTEQEILDALKERYGEREAEVLEERPTIAPRLTVSPTKSMSEIIEEVARSQFGGDMVPGTYLDADGKKKCDEVIDLDGGLVPHVEAWRNRVDEVSEIIFAYQRVIGG